MSKKTIGQIADEARKIYIEKRDAEAAVTKLKEAYDKKLLELMEAADLQGLAGGKGTIASFTIGEDVVPQVADWNKFYKFIYKNNYGHLLERRPSVTGCRELWDTKGPIPGVEKFTKRKVNLRGVE